MTQNKIRTHLNDSVLFALAENIAAHVTVRTDDRGTSHDIMRDSTAEEYELIRDIAYGALLGLNWGEDVRTVGSKGEQAILDTAEFTLLHMAQQHLELLEGEDAHINTYDTIYLPLKRTLKSWAENY